MKKTRKVLSVVLSFLVALASMPMMYTATAAAGTRDNPTTALEESNPYEYNDLFKLNIKHSNNNFFFYQTIDDEYFVLKQDLYLQQYTVALGSNRTLTFHGINFYTGGSNLANATDVAGVIEEPAITTNPTSDFITNYYVSDSWVSTHNNTSDKDCTGDVNIEASGWDLNGRHKEYTWQHSIVFQGHSAGTTGQINTGYYERATWDWDDGKGATASMDFRIKTTITVVDAREFVEELAKAENVVSNPGNYSDAYVSAVKATLDDIPEDLKNLSARYTQSIVNSFTELLTSIPENCADYTEFNRVLAECRAFTNDGTYSIRSYKAYVEQIESINAGLPKNLDASQQAFVDSAVQALLAAKELLVIEFPGSGSTTTSDVEDLTSVVENVFNFIQIEDDQVLAFTQSWSMTRGSKSSNRMFYITLDTTDANTASFAPRFTTDCITTIPTLTSGAIQGTLSNQTIFTNWYEVDANGNPKADVTAISEGLIDPNYGGFQEGTKYYFENGLSFVGLSANESGSRTFTYNQKVYVNWTQWIIVTVNHYNSATYTTTINITDARPLIEAYNDALATLENPGEYSERYIETLEEIVNSVPQDMINGTTYYTQAQVDKLYEALTTLNDRDADYTGLEEAYQRVEEILANPDAYSGATLTAAQAAKNAADALERNLIDSLANRELIASVIAGLNSAADNAEARGDYSTYKTYIDICHSMRPTDFTGDAYREFMEVVEAVESTLPMDLGTSQQGVINEACDKLLNAYLKLTGGSVTDPDSVGPAFTQDAITGEYTNGVIKFTIDYPEYNFTQTLNDEKLSIKTNITISSNDATKTVVLTGLKISSLDAGELANLDTSGNCYNSGSVIINQAENLFCKENIDANVVQGVEMYAADANGDMAHFTTWQNTAGVPLSTSGLINSVTTLTTENSSASAEYIYTSAGGGDPETKTRTYTYVLRLAWTEDGVEHHAHIPVTFTVSDARNLRTTYYSYMDFINAGNDGTYTDASFEAAAEIMASVNTDIVSGNGYYTQEQIDAESAKLANALTALQTKADYSEIDSLVSQLQGILNNGGQYTEGSITAINNALAAAEALNKDLSSDYQTTVDAVVDQLTEALNNAQKGADYTEFDSAVEALEGILANPDGYTQETIDSIIEALEKAENFDRDLDESEQDRVNDFVADLNEVIDGVEEKADYTDYNNAKNEADNLVNDDGNGNPIYDEDAFNEYKEAIENIDNALDKDLSKDEQSKVNDATSSLEDLKATLEENKYADYTDFDAAKDALEEIVNAPAGTYTDETVQKAQDALDNANTIPEDMVVGENNANQDIINDATQNMQDVIDSVEKKADYSEFDKVVEELEEIVNAPEGTYTDETVKNAQDALDSIVDVDKDLSESEQDVLDEIVSDLQDVVDSAEKKADYTEFDKVVEELEDIVNAPEGTYTDETVKNAQDALDSIVDVDKDLSESEQDVLDEVVSDLQDVVDSAEKKADYTEFDKVVEELEEIVNAPEGTYTDETVKNAQDALDSIVDVDKDLSESEQDVLDEIVSDLQDVIDSVEEKADYTDYNNAKNEADNLVNDDGNGNPIYDEDAFNEYKEAIENIDNALDKDLSKDEQSRVNDAVAALENLKTHLEESKYYTVTFLDADGNAIGTDRFFAGALFGSVNAPALPEDTDAFAYVGWIYENGTLVSSEDVLSGNVTVQVAREDKVLNLNNEALSIHTSTGYITSEVRDMTVAEFLAMFANDADCLEVKDLAGNVLASDDLVGTGAAITLKSKYTENVYETRTVVVYGDVTGDGLVNADDYAQAKLANIIPGTYNADNYYFFVANDVTPDGYIDALDSAYINLMVKGYK